MKPVIHELKRKIAIAIKNQLDISDLIKDIDISELDLSYAIIKNINRANQTFNKVIFTNAKIGKEGQVTNLSRNRFIDCKFDDTKFLGKVFIRHSKFENCDFANAWMPYVEAQYAEFDDRCNFCETFLRLGVAYLHKAKFGVNLFKDLLRFTNLTVIEKEE